MRKFFAFLISNLLLTTAAWACDPCAIFNAARLQGHQADSFGIAISEQYTDFKEGKEYPENSRRTHELVKGFSTTQLGFYYDPTEKLGLQVSLPIITRYLEQTVNYRTSSEYDSGIGDISLLGSYSLVNIKELNWSWLTGFSAGIKLPTGDTGVLNEISNEEGADQDKVFFKHHQVGSVSGGRALTFGSGSYDYILGTNSLLRWKKYLVLMNLQYTIRTEGDFNYQYDNDLLWSVMPAYYVLLEHQHTLATGLSLSGEYKGKDQLNGIEVAGSDLSNLYVGPEMFFTYLGKYSGQLGVDFRISNADPEADIVPDTRIRASVAYRF